MSSLLLSPELSQALHASTTELVCAINLPEMEDPQWLEGVYHNAMEVFAREGWNDPAMDVYEALDPRRAP